MKKIVVAVVVSIFFAGCATPSGVVGTPAKGSKFSKLEIGMSRNQVENLIGHSKDCQAKADNTNLIPLVGVFMADGIIYIVCPYAGEGVLAFGDSGQKLSAITVDTNQGAYMHK